MKKQILKIKHNLSAVVSKKITSLGSRFKREFIEDQAGLATIEYAIVMIAAATLAGILIMIVKSDAVHNALQNLITNALQVKQ